MFLSNNRAEELLLFLTISLCIFTITKSLACYDCFWDDSPDTIEERLKELPKLKDRNFPVSVTYIGKIIKARAPTGEEIRSNCEKIACQSQDSSCLKWSYISNSPKNITYTCVGNPQKRSGCFEHEIKSKDNKKYLKIQACLCEEDLCNGAFPRRQINFATLFTFVVILVLYSKIINVAD